MRGGGSRLESRPGGNMAKRRRVRFSRERQRYNPSRPQPEDDPWEGDDDDAGATH